MKKIQSTKIYKLQEFLDAKGMSQADLVRLTVKRTGKKHHNLQTSLNQAINKYGLDIRIDDDFNLWVGKKSFNEFA